MEILHFAKSRRGGELIGIVILAAGLSLGAALVTYHPDDSSAFYTSTNNAISNAIGYYGATVAWIFVGFFGFASLLFPLGMLVIGWQRFWGKDVEYVQTKAFGWVTLLIAVPPLLDLIFGKVWLRGALIAAGGYLGQEIDAAAAAKLNRGGAAILFGTMLLVGLLLSTRISLAAIFVAIKEAIVALGRGASLQWARLAEAAWLVTSSAEPSWLGKRTTRIASCSPRPRRCDWSSRTKSRLRTTRVRSCAK